jgi:hypothetical protein
MSRYVVRAAKPLFIETPLWDDAHRSAPSLTVDDAKTVKTGLVDLYGNDIMRVAPPVGFGRDEEW